MASGVYNRLKYNLMKKLVDLSTDVLKVILLNGSHAFNADHNVKTDVNSNELANGNGYTTDGVTLSGQTVTQDNANDCAIFDANDVSWTTATFTAYHAVIVDTSVSDNLVLSIDFGGAKSVSAGTFTIQWSANGILKLA